MEETFMQRTRVSQGLVPAILAVVALALAGCATSGSSMADSNAMMKDTEAGMAPMAPAMAMDPMKSERAAIDRFGSFAHLQMRDAMNHLPGPNAPVDFDKPPFVTTGLGPHGETVMYYNFDIQSTASAPIYSGPGESLPWHPSNVCLKGKPPLRILRAYQ
jgi:hypothetical protein